MAFLLWLNRKMAHKLKQGDVFLSYLVTYPIFRFLMEFLRLDNSFVGGVNANQTLMLVIALAATALIIWRHREEIFKRGSESAGQITASDTEDQVLLPPKE